MAVRIQRQGDISERLYQFATIYKERKQELIDQRTQRKLTPQARRKSSSPSRLFSPIKHTKEVKNEFPFQPCISAKSRAIADGLGSPESRLLKCPSVRVNPEFSEDLQSFKPQINQRSEQLALSRESPGRRWEVLYKERELLDRKREQLCQKSAYLDDEKDECSFHPLVPGLESSKRSKSPLYLRLANKNQDRLQELTELRRKELQTELESCTFSPVVHEYEGSPHVEIGSKRGVERHFERIARANAEKEEKAKILDRFNGETWTNTPTHPKAPILGRHTPSSIKRIKRHIDFS